MGAHGIRRAAGRYRRRWPGHRWRRGTHQATAPGRLRRSYCMASDPRVRASDADRDRTAALLREHHAAGRLTAEEFNERLDKAYAAKTLGDLDQLLSDLPGIDLYHLPDHSVERR